MIIIYIRKIISDEEIAYNVKIPKIIKKLWIKIQKKLNIIIRKQIDNNILYIIPNINGKSLEKKLNKKLQKEGKNIKIVLSNDVKNIKIDSRNVIDGKNIQKYAIKEILEYIINQAINKEEAKLEFQDIYILQKEHNYETTDMIQYLANKVKTINIITNSIDRYKRLEDNMYNDGYLITVSNNKKKSLKKAKIILNMDFSKEELMLYAINRNSIIINFTKEKIDNLKGFEGIIINKIEIDMNDELKQYFKKYNIYDRFSNIELYESICEKEKFIEQTEKIHKNGVKVIELIGNNGKISEKEPLFNKIFLTNLKN